MEQEPVLSPNEKKLLMNTTPNMSTAEATNATGLSFEAVLQAGYMLQDKGLVVVDEKSTEMLSLSEEGERYAREGLPERRCFSMLSEPTPVDEVKEWMGDEAGIALGWLKKKRWVRIEQGMVVPNSAPSGEDEKLLELILGKKNVSTEELTEEQRRALGTLKKRGLVLSSTSREFFISPTKAGAEASQSVVLTEEIAQLTPELIKSKQWQKSPLRRYDVHAYARPAPLGKRHPYMRILESMRAIMLSMGFTEIRGEVIQSSFWNFDALFQPQDHPAREMQDTFYLESEEELPQGYEAVKRMHEHGGDIGSDGWGGKWSEQLARKHVLRTHTTAISLKYLSEHPEPPVKAFCIDRVYRREAIDATHTPEFEQLEGVVMDRKLSLKHLFGCLSTFYAKMGFEEVRFRPAYFPYTEPSVEPEVHIKGLGWVELGGAGIFRKEVTEPLGIRYPVLAWGLGVSRVAMLRLGLKDLRQLYQPDIEWLREEPVFRR
ncbi:MAG: phenylalanine--tRNA ligase subunit alpha [Methermicoccaceae archaeon]